MKKTRKQQFMVLILCIMLVLTQLGGAFCKTVTVHAGETETEGEENPYTVTDFFAYMQHGYTEYNVFCENPNKKNSLFVSDENYEYRAINTDSKDVTGEIAVICDRMDADDAEQVEDNSDEESEEEAKEDTSKEPGTADYAKIAYTIEQDEETYISRIYSGTRLPEALSFTYIQADDMKPDDLTEYDLYIFEESAKDTGISEEMFLYLNSMLKEKKDTLIYDLHFTVDTYGTGEADGSDITVVENSENEGHILLVSEKSDGYLVGMSTKGNGYIVNGTPKQKDKEQKIFVQNGYGYKWTSYMTYEQRLSYGVLMYEPYTTIKVLPTYEGDTLDRNLFKNTGAKVPKQYLRYTRQVVLPSNIKKIPYQTFMNYDVLESINLDHVSKIGNESFYGCKLLKNVQFSENETVTIGESAFEDCGLVDIVLPGSVRSVGDNAFSGNYETDPRSLEHYATTYDKYKEYQAYMKEQTEAEAKNPSIKSVNIQVSDDGTGFGKNSFTVDDTCQVKITYVKEIGIQVFEFTKQDESKWEASEIESGDLVFIKHIKYLRSETEGNPGEAYDNQETNKDENIHNVTFVYTNAPNCKSVIQVKNNESWKTYFMQTGQPGGCASGMDLKFSFGGWMTKDGNIINPDSVIQLQTDITLYTRYIISGSDAEKTFKIHFYNSNKTIEVKPGKRLYDYDVPAQTREGDIFLGWTNTYPIYSLDDIIIREALVFPDVICGAEETTLYPVFQSDVENVENKTRLVTTEVLSGEPVYRLNDNNIGFIKKFGIDSYDEYNLDRTDFNEFDKQNAEIIKNKIISAGNQKIAILPKGYTVDGKKLEKKGYSVIKTNLELDDYTSALTYMNCRYFQYLKLIQTPHVEDEGELKNTKQYKEEGKFGHYGNLCVQDFEIEAVPDCSSGFIYFINKDTFKNYYDLCMDMETKLINTANSINLHKGMKITDAVWAVNNLVIDSYAYDQPLEIYDLYWMLQTTDESRNESKKADHHGVCASYSKLAFALLGLYGCEAIPCTSMVEENGVCHSINKIMMNGKAYYFDFCWTNSYEPTKYMFMLESNMIFMYHRGLTMDDMGHTISYNRNLSKLSALKIKSAKNQKGKKVLVTFNKVKNADGYEIQYSTNSNFKSAKKNSISKTKCTITGLKKNKTYYIRIRPYKNVKLYEPYKEKLMKVKYYGSWSKYKKVKIKK
ncbi:MAG: fibronectin type III domain-containing protein [Clostridiales bacterium]|nr:fibronectin type III domain-containing protein [Clostridiales bacterium]